MKVLVAGVHFHSSFGWSIVQALERAGHQVLEFEYRDFPGTRFPGSRRLRQRFRMPQQLIRTAVSFRPDLLWIGKGEAIPGEAVAEVRRRTGCRAVNWFPDPDLFAHRRVAAQIPHLDLVLSKNREDIDRINELRPGVGHMLQHAADRTLHVGYTADGEQLEAYGCDVAMVGSCYPYRESLMAQLLDYDLKIWGPGWSASPIARLKPECVMGLEARSFEQTTVFQAARVNINTHFPADGINLNQRVFDIAGAGSCQLVEGPRDLDGIFRAPEDIEVFDSVSNLRERLDALLSDPERRAEMGARSRSIVASGHTYDDRVAEVLDLLG